MASPMGPSVSRDFALVRRPLLRSQTWPQTVEFEDLWLREKQTEWLLQGNSSRRRHQRLHQRGGQLCMRRQQQRHTQEGQREQQQEDAHTADKHILEKEQEQEHQQTQPQKKKRKEKQHEQQQRQPPAQAQEDQQRPLLRPQEKQQRLLLLPQEKQRQPSPPEAQEEQQQHCRRQQKPQGLCEGQVDVTQQQQPPDRFYCIGEDVKMQGLTRNSMAASSAGGFNPGSAANIHASSATTANMHAVEGAYEAASALHASSAVESHCTAAANASAVVMERQMAAAGASEGARGGDATAAGPAGAAGPAAAAGHGPGNQITEERAATRKGITHSTAATVSAAAAAVSGATSGTEPTQRNEEAAWETRCSSPTTSTGGGKLCRGEGGAHSSSVGSSGSGVTSASSPGGSSSTLGGTSSSSPGGNSSSTGDSSSSEEAKRNDAGDRSGGHEDGSTTHSSESSSSSGRKVGEGQGGDRGRDTSSIGEDGGRRSSNRRSTDDYVVHSMDEHTITFTYKGFLFSSVTRRKRRLQRRGQLAEKNDAGSATAGGQTDSSSSSRSGPQEASAAVGGSADRLCNEHSLTATDPTSAGAAEKLTATAAATAAAGAVPSLWGIPPPTPTQKANASSFLPHNIATAGLSTAIAASLLEVASSEGRNAAAGAAASHDAAGPAAAGEAARRTEGDTTALPHPLWHRSCCSPSQQTADAAAPSEPHEGTVKQQQQHQQQQHQNKAEISHPTALSAGLASGCCPQLCTDYIADAAAVAVASASSAAAAFGASSAAVTVSAASAATAAAAAVDVYSESPAAVGQLHSSAVFCEETAAGVASSAAAATAAAAAVGASPADVRLLQEISMGYRSPSGVTEDSTVQVSSVSRRHPRSSAAAASTENTPGTAAAAAIPLAVGGPFLLDIPLVQAEPHTGCSNSSSWTSSSYCSNQTTSESVTAATGRSSGSTFESTRRSDSSSTPGVGVGSVVDSSGTTGERRGSSSSSKTTDGAYLAEQFPFCMHSGSSSSNTFFSGEKQPVGSASAAGNVAVAQLLTGLSQTSGSTAAVAAAVPSAVAEASSYFTAAAAGEGKRGEGTPRDEQVAATAADKEPYGSMTKLFQQMTQRGGGSVRGPAAAEDVQAAPAGVAAVSAATAVSASATAAPPPAFAAAAAASSAAVQWAPGATEEAAVAEEKSEWTMPAVEAFILQLRRGELRGSHQAARRTAEVLRQVVDQHPWKTTQELVDVVKQLGRSFLRADPMEFLVSNVVRRILCIIRTEHCKQLRKRQPQEEDEDEEGYSEQLQLLEGLSSSGSTGAHGDMTRLPLLRMDRFRTSPLRSTGIHASSFPPYPRSSSDDPQDLLLPVPATVKHSIFEGISELVAEVDTAWEEGEDVRTACFSNGDCILTYGYSLAVERLLKALHRKNQGEGATHSSRKKKKKGRMRCSFQVLVLGGDTEQGGKKMAERLVASGIKTAYVADAALLTVIHKVDKVLLGTRAILSSGGAVALSGARYVAEAAKIYNRPVMVVAPLFKLTHLPLYDQHSRNQLLSPSAVLPDLPELKNVSVRIPKYDYIPDNLLTVFITEIGPVDPSCLFFLAQQRYDIEDLDLYAVV